MKKTIFLLTLICIASMTFAEDIKKDTIFKHINLSEYTISASRANLKLKNIPGKVEIISKRVIENSNSSNLGELLKKTVGVDIVSYPGMLSGISIRGFQPKVGENNYTVILIDGIPAGTDNISTISLNNVKNIEILKGPYSSLYGSQAMGGIINIVTNDNKGTINSSIELAYGSYNKHTIKANTGGMLTDKFGFNISVQHEKQNSNYEVGESTFATVNSDEKTLIGLDIDDLKIKNSTYAKSNFDIKLKYNVNNNIKTSFGYSFFKADDVRNPGSIFSPYPTIKNLDRHNLNTNIKANYGINSINLNAFYSIDNADNLEAKDQAKYNDPKTKVSSLDDNYLSLQKKNEVIGAQLYDIITINNHKLTIGLDYKTNNYTTERWNAKNTNITPYNPDYINSKLGVYAQANLLFLEDKLSVSTGIRQDMIKLEIDENKDLNSLEQKENFNSFNYNIGAKYNLNENLNVYSSFGTAFLSPTALQRSGSYTITSAWGSYKFIGNPDLKAESSKTFELGMNYNKSGLKSNISWFTTQFENKITQGSNATGDAKQYVNSEGAKMKGLELDFSYDLKEFFNDAISIEPFVKWTWLYEATEEIEDNKTIKDKDLLYVKEHNGVFGLRISDINTFDASFSTRYAGSRMENIFGLGNKEMPSYYVFDMSTSYKINEMFKISVYANNFLDERYCEKYGYIMPGRNFMAKLNINF